MPTLKTRLAAVLDPSPFEHRNLTPALDAEAQAYLWERAYVPMGLVGAVAMALFGLMDWLLYPQHLPTLLPLRIGGLVAPYLAVAAIARYARRHFHPYWLGLGLQIVLTLSVCAMFVVIGDWTAPYWLLLLIAAIYSNTVPWPAPWAVGSTLIVTVVYGIGSLLFGDWNNSLGLLLFYNLSLFVTTFLGVAAIHRPLMTLRWQSFLRQHQLAEAQADLQTAYQTLQQYTTELEASNAELDAFSHTVAHDLKNPISTLVGFSTLLEASISGMSAEKVVDILRRITAAGYRLTRIVDELLLLASVRKMEQVKTGPLDMRVIVVEVQERLADMIAKTQAEIITPAAWPEALGYAPWVEEVWTNYLSNALKYGGTSPRVELGADLTGFENLSGLNVARFWVQDNGAGLTAEQQSRLFTQFTRLHQVRIEGHGLGLSIVQRIVTKLGGEVGVESEVGRGSRFWFTLLTQENVNGA